MSEVRKFLTLSTAHIPPLMQNIGLEHIESVVAYRTTYGWFMWVPDDPVESSDADVDPTPADLLAIQIHARSLGCDYVMFDADGPIEEAIPNWE